MARARLIKPGFFTNAKLAALPPHARLLFAGLWTLADRAGRLKDDPPAIKGALFPYEDVDCNQLLTILSRSGFVSRYRADSVKYLAIVTFLKHQTPHIREPESQIPEAPEKHSASTMPASGQNSARTAFAGTSTADPVPVPVPVTVPVPVPVPVTGPLDEEDEVAAAFAAYGTVNSGTVQSIHFDVEEYGIDWVRRANRLAAASGFSEKPPWSYVSRILKRWQKQDGPDEEEPRGRNGNDTDPGLASRNAEHERTGAGEPRKLVAPRRAGGGTPGESKAAP